LYDALIELAPNIRNVISTPRQMIAIKFVEMINHIVAFSEDPARMRDQMPAIAARHIAYGVQRHHANIMGQVLTTVLGEAMEDEWTEEIQEAWSSNWDVMCSALFTEMNNWEAFAAPAAALWSRLRRKWTPAVFGQQIVPRINQSLPFLVHEFTAAWKEDRAANGDRSGVDAAGMYAGSGGGGGGGQRGAQKRSSPLASTATLPRKAGVGAGLGGKLARMLSGSSRDNDGSSPHQQGAWLTNTRQNSSSIDEHVHFVSSPSHSTAIPTLNSSVCEDGRASSDGRMSHSADDMPSSSKNTRSPPLRKGLLFDLNSPPDMSPMGLPSSLASSRGSLLASRVHGKGGVATGVATVDKKSVRRHSMLKTSATDEERLAQDAADAFGQEIWQVMNIATDMLWEPDARNERMISTGEHCIPRPLVCLHTFTLSARSLCARLFLVYFVRAHS
jgi:hemoglobin-like flavoprotein